MKCAALATIDLPDPVGVAKMTLSPDNRASDASSCAGYSEIPREEVQEVKESQTASSISVLGTFSRSAMETPSVGAEALEVTSPTVLKARGYSSSSGISMSSPGPSVLSRSSMAARKFSNAAPISSPLGTCASPGIIFCGFFLR